MIPIAARKPLGAALMSLVAGAAVAAGWLLHELHQQVVPPGEAAVVEIRPGTTAREAATALEEAGVVDRPTLLVGWLRLRGDAGKVQAGRYRFEGATSVVEAAEIVTSGRVILQSVTIPEGSTRWQVARRLSQAGFGSYDRALAATGDPALVSDLDPGARSLEGYLFPDTYRADSTARVEEVVESMVERFRRAWTAPRRARAVKLGMAVRQVVTLASLVEAEAAVAHERPLISAVYHNRLERGMLLQCDPTLLYALALQGRTDRDIRWRDFELDSPYNTYRYPGLPAGPIGNPGEASLDAALSPYDVDYLYFVSRNDGSHVFSRTLSRHNAMVRKYQR